MKKIYSLLAIFLCIGLIAPVCAFPIEKTHMDSWGRTMMFDNGDAIYFGQTVAVTESSISYNYEYEVFENCTVTIKTDGHVVVVDENGDQVISKNGFGFSYTSNWRFTSCMTWNNFPRAGGAPVKHVEFVDTDFVQYLLNSVCTGIDYTQLPETISYGDITLDLSRPSYVDGSYYDWYWYPTGENDHSYINIWGDGVLKLYDGVFEGWISSESHGYVDFYTLEDFNSALKTTNDAFCAGFGVADDDAWTNFFCFEISLQR